MEIVETLKSIGFTPGEAKTYLALLEIGTSTVGKIVERAEVTASKVYIILDKLMNRGLVTLVVKNGTKYFTSSDPETILDFLDVEEQKIEKNKQKINDILPQLKLKKDSVENKPLAELSLGKKGFENFLNELCLTAKETSNYRGLAGYEINQAMKHVWPIFNKKLENKKIKLKLIYDHDSWYKKDPKIHKRHERKYFYPKILDRSYENLPNISILGNKTIISGMDEKNKVFALIIRNKQLTNAFIKLLNIIEQNAKIPENYGPTQS